MMLAVRYKISIQHRQLDIKFRNFISNCLCHTVMDNIFNILLTSSYTFQAFYNLLHYMYILTCKGSFCKLK